MTKEIWESIPDKENVMACDLCKCFMRGASDCMVGCAYTYETCEFADDDYPMISCSGYC